MHYRTKTYIAGAWDESSKAIQQLYKWNESNYWSLHFVDAHDLTQARDSSLPCSIKESLRIRLSASKLFVLVVGNATSSVKKGSCQYCNKYHSFWGAHVCESKKTPDIRSFVEYECDIAANAFRKGEMSILVLYDSLTVNRAKCPESVAHIGTHLPMIYRDSASGEVRWNYHRINAAFLDLI